MIEKRKIISISEAVEKLMNFPLEPKSEWLPLRVVNDRFLSQDLNATMDLPAFTRAAFDGYALRSEDTTEASLFHAIDFEVVQDIGAGDVPSVKVGPFQTVRIMTGAQLPEECDSIIPLEVIHEVEKNGIRYAPIKRIVEAHDHIQLRGEEARNGEVLVKKGTRINAGTVALLATFGYDKVPVAKKPIIGILSTGSELLEVSEPMEKGKIRNSNAYMLAAQVEKIGAEARYFGIVKDDFESTLQGIQKSLEEVDILITTGGVSVGDFDLMPKIYKELGADLLFNKVAMRPGSVTTVAHLNGKLLYGLSGNPSACFVGLELFLRPILRAACFSPNPHLIKITAYLDIAFPNPNPFDRFVRSKLLFENATLKVTPCGMDKSNIVKSLASSDCLTLLPGGRRGFKKDDLVEVFLLKNDEGSEWPWKSLLSKS